MDQKIDLKVQKRDGKFEDYDPEKIKKVVIAAGLSEENSNLLIQKINSWIKAQEADVLTSIEIRDQIIVELQALDENAAKKFSWWEKYKDKNFNNQ